MLVGLGGNNGSTFTAGILANKLKTSWETKQGIQHPNFFGSFTQSATAHMGFRHNKETGKLQDVFKPINEIMPMVNPCDFEISGWDINSRNLFDAAKNAHVLEPSLLNALKPQLEAIVPLPSILN
jgi:myo-inositol-1-phosphate synthase